MKQITFLTGHSGVKDNNADDILIFMQRNVSRNDSRRGIKISEKISEDLAYLCGVFAGDGSINYRRKKNEYSLKVVGNPKDEKEFYHLVIGPKFEKVFGIIPKMKYHDSRTTYGFSVYSKTIYAYLVQTIGLSSGVKYGSLKIPEIFLADEKLTIAFVRGVFDTDGCISFKRKSLKSAKKIYPTISLSSKSAYFIKHVVMFLEKIGFKVWTQYDHERSDFRMKKGYTIISTLNMNGYTNLNLWMDKIGFYSPKHLKKIREHEKLKSDPRYTFLLCYSISLCISMISRFISLRASLNILIYSSSNFMCCSKELLLDL